MWLKRGSFGWRKSRFIGLGSRLNDQKISVEKSLFFVRKCWKNYRKSFYSENSVFDVALEENIK